MCYICGSIDQATSICPMCKVFKPITARCPHIREVCRNPTLHPRHDVVYLKNAEVPSFNGCGYCKWAQMNPPPKQSGPNPGFPGCCRPPTHNELQFIPAADWPAVSIIHNIPIPPHILKLLPPNVMKLLESVSQRAPFNPAPIDRKSSGNSSPSNRHSPLTKTLPIPAPNKGRQGGSPQLLAAPLSSTPRGVPSPAPSPSLENRRHEQGEKRKQNEPENSTARRPSNHRPSGSHNSPSATVAKLAGEPQPSQPLRRRSSTASSSPPLARPLPPTRTSGRQSPAVAPRAQITRALSSASSSDGSDHSFDSLTDGTMTTDGAFTDYLSEESEAELERQAEARAIYIAQTQAEEQEFKAARQKLANVDLRPPKSWNPSA